MAVAITIQKHRFDYTFSEYIMCIQNIVLKRKKQLWLQKLNKFYRTNFKIKIKYLRKYKFPMVFF